MNKPTHFTLTAVSGALLALSLSLGSVAHAAKIKIINGDPAGAGFNDPTPVAPVGGNDGTTLGQQRMNVYKHVAKLWEKELPEGPTIAIEGRWSALSCTATSGVLGSAGTYSVWRDFTNAPHAGTWYSAALANTLAGADLDVDETGNYPEIISQFNVNLGKPGCLEASGFYLGLDGEVPEGMIHFAAVLLHEVGHGMGFQALTSGLSGLRIEDETGPYPAQWERLMYDNTAGKTWFDMTDAERVTSGVNGRQLVWIGPNAVAATPSVLKPGTPLLSIKSKAFPEIVGNYQVGTAGFGPALTPGTAVTAPIGRVIDQADGVTGWACTPLDAANAALVAGRLALVDRGSCAFTIKAKNVQDAGAIGMLVADNAPGSPPSGMSGTDDSIVIPSVRITQADGAKIKAVLTGKARQSEKVTGKLGVDKTRLAGADPMGRPLLYSPNPYQSGSSVSHWDTLAFPNQLMEPFISSDLTKKLTPPKDLTVPLLLDIGWGAAMAPMPKAQ